MQQQFGLPYYSKEDLEDVHPFHRLRTLSSSKWEESPFYTLGMNSTYVNKVEQYVEENENSYAAKGLESCIKTGASPFFEYMK